VGLFIKYRWILLKRICRVKIINNNHCVKCSGSITIALNTDHKGLITPYGFQMSRYKKLKYKSTFVDKSSTIDIVLPTPSSLLNTNLLSLFNPLYKAQELGL